MSRPLPKLQRFFRELKRRNVYQVAVTYLTFVRLGLPNWTVTLVIVLVAMGLPLAIVLAWAFEMTADGVRRTPRVEAPDEEREEEDGFGRSSRAAYKLLVAIGP